MARLAEMSRDPLLVEAFRIRNVARDIARTAGISKAAVSQWKRVPEKHVWAVTKITGIPPHKLRPDIVYLKPPKKRRRAGRGSN